MALQQEQPRRIPKFGVEGIKVKTIIGVMILFATLPMLGQTTAKPEASDSDPVALLTALINDLECMGTQSQTNKKTGKVTTVPINLCSWKKIQPPGFDATEDPKRTIPKKGESVNGQGHVIYCPKGRILNWDKTSTAKDDETTWTAHCYLPDQIKMLDQLAKQDAAK